MSTNLTQDQIDQYQGDGALIYRGLLTEAVHGLHSRSATRRVEPGDVLDNDKLNPIVWRK